MKSKKVFFIRHGFSVRLLCCNLQNVILTMKKNMETAVATQNFASEIKTKKKFATETSKERKATRERENESGGYPKFVGLTRVVGGYPGPPRKYCIGVQH